MADVFISYSQLDRERVKPLAERLASLGYSVWWDKAERGRQALIDERAQALEAARAVIVVWSLDGRDALQVHADGAAALDAGKLLQLKIEAVALPLPFNTIPAADMTGAGEWGLLEDALSRLVKDGEGSAAPTRILLGPAPVIAATGAPKVITIALAAVLASYAGALGAGFNGVMAVEQLQVALFGVLAVGGACAGLCAHRLFTVLRAAA